jgi:Rrf2 family protein
MLSKKAKYSIKALIALSKNDGKPPMHVSQISEQEKIPRKYLEVILLELRNGGYLHSKKGVGGGYVLSKAPEDIYLDGVVRLIDGPIAQVYCASTYHYHKCEECPVEETCSIRNLYLEIRAADLKILSKTSIADMIAKESTLADGLLNLPVSN